MGGGGQLSKHRKVELNPHLAVPGSSRHLKNMWNNEWPPWRLQVKQVTTRPPAVPTRHRECKDSRGRCSSCFLIGSAPVNLQLNHKAREKGPLHTFEAPCLGLLLPPYSPKKAALTKSVFSLSLHWPGRQWGWEHGAETRPSTDSSHLQRL